MSRIDGLKCYFEELLQKNIEKGNSELWKEHEQCAGEEYKTGYFQFLASELCKDFKLVSFSKSLNYFLTRNLDLNI